jgi:hypothetical protein
VQRRTVREFDMWSSCATGSFVVLVIAAVVVVWPYEWLFGHSSHQLMDSLLDADPPADESAVLRHLAYYNDENHDTNAATMGWLFVAFAVGCLLLLAEIGSWLAALAT